MKNYKIKVCFHSGKSDIFGYSNDSVECLVSEAIKDAIVSAIANDDSGLKILSVDTSNGTRYINMRTVLYVDVKEVDDEEKVSKFDEIP